MKYFKYINQIKPGDMVELISMVGEPQMKAGLKGKVKFIDDICQIHVQWQNGSSLALVPEDKFKIIHNSN